MAWTPKSVIMLKKFRICTNSVTNSVVSFNILSTWQWNFWKISDRISRICLISRMELFNVFVFVHIKLQCFVIFILDLDNRITLSETSTKTLYSLLKIKFRLLQTILKDNKVLPFLTGLFLIHKTSGYSI